ncbi:MAG: TFIIB-type zinc ribbon-containing protein [Armatimonadota bacterium]
MQCPVCNNTLTAVERSGIEIDVCPQCKGVWLDRGELEKLIQLELRGSTSIDDRSIRRDRDDDDEDDDDHRRGIRFGDDDDQRYSSTDPRRRKKKGFLGGIFEMFE